jgi:hypothetical protein
MWVVLPFNDWLFSVSRPAPKIFTYMDTSPLFDNVAFIFTIVV